MRIILTREASDSRLCARLLVRDDIAGIPAPLLMHEALTPALPADTSTLVLTSRHAALALPPTVRKVFQGDVFCVGTATGRAARAAGFANVVCGVADGAALARRMLARPPYGAVVHLAGEDVGFDIAATLRAAGVSATRLSAYRMRAAAVLPPSAETALRAGGADAVGLMSARTACLWVALVQSAGLAEAARNLRHLCLSQAIAAELAGLSPPRIAIAERPDGTAALALARHQKTLAADPVDLPNWVP